VFVESVNKEGKPRIAGTLLAFDGSTNLWKRRHFILTGTDLVYQAEALDGCTRTSNPPRSQWSLEALA